MIKSFEFRKEKNMIRSLDARLPGSRVLTGPGVRLTIFSIFLFLLNVDLMAQEPGGHLPPWQPGYLDLHHISTGRGDAALYVLPDGTTLLIDAGDMSESHPRTTSLRNTPQLPNASKTTGEWIADYIFQFHPKGKNATLDYALITHFHDDHYGEIDETSNKSEWGDYLITGITEVGEHVPILTMIDRGYPDYNFPENMKSAEFKEKMQGSKDPYDNSGIKTLEEYWKFLAVQAEQRNMGAEKFKVGSSSQVYLKYEADRFPGFSVRNIHGNGLAWTGWEDETFPIVTQKILKGTPIPGENSLSLGIRIRYGKFDYFTGGDIAGVNAVGETDLKSMESQVAPAIGPVDVATLNHHGNRDSQSAYYVRTVRPKVWIQQGWSSDHPGEEVLRRISSKELYPGDRYILSTSMLEANRLVIGDKIDRLYHSTEGHIVVRVFEKGKRYMIFILDDKSRERTITKVIGPVESR